MARTDIGRAVPLLKGEYSPTTTYELNDIVSLNGSFYWHYSHEQTTNVAPQATSTWKVVINLADAEAYIARAEFAAESAEDAAEIATAAKTAAESASTTATGASATATTAKNDAVTAKTAAETAQAGAVTAKTAAETARDAAQASATAAGTSATNAGNSAGTAEYYAGIATTAGETASEKATEATGAATTATSAAATATSAKDTAVSSASTASTAATTATSAATAAQAVKDSIPEDYSQLSADVGDLKTQLYVNDSDFDSVTFTGKNLLNPNGVIENKYVDQSTGKLIENTNYNATAGYIEVEPETEYILSYFNTIGNRQEADTFSCRIVQYAADFSFISGTLNTATVTTAANAKYIRFSYIKTHDKEQFEKGTTPTVFENYHVELDPEKIDVHLYYDESKASVNIGAAPVNVDQNNNTVVGVFAGYGNTSGQRNVFVGKSALAESDTSFNATGVGANTKTAPNAVAIGEETEARGTNGTAIGQGVKANYRGAVAIGKDSQNTSAQAFIEDDFVLGTARHKYRTPGLFKDVRVESSTLNVQYGEEMISDLSAWTGNGATWDGSKWAVSENGYISTTITVEADTDYLISLTVSGAKTENATLNPCTISLGSDSLAIFGADDANWNVVLTPNTAGSVVLSIGGATWYGNISAVSCKKITSYVNAAIRVNNRMIMMQGNSVAYGTGLQKEALRTGMNVGIGYFVQDNLKSGVGNVGVGFQVHTNIKNGSHNTGIGESAERKISTGMYNVGIGYASQTELTTGCWNVAMGNETQRDVTDGCNNVAIGRRAQNSMQHGHKNVALGAQAGFNRDIVLDTVATIDAVEQTFVGYQATQASATQADRATAVGSHANSESDGLALGAYTSAGGAGSVAIGRDKNGNAAKATQDNDFVLGTSEHRFILGNKVLTFNNDGTVTWQLLS